MGQIKKTYTKDEKLQAVKLNLEGELSYKAVAERLRIPDTRTVRLWVKGYREEWGAVLGEKREKSPNPTGTGRPRKHRMSLKEEVRRLRAENEFLKKWLEIEGKWIVGKAKQQPTLLLQHWQNNTQFHFFV